MSYQVIARKWRPQKFSDMVGQEHIARTLQNAVKSGRIAHAYLFVGPRGIGKTTTARIFAKALNCTNPQDGEPCCQCESCRSIADETNVDVIEIDAATHTQVEKARELCEDVLHLPISSKYKIYIIDEVHMLSKSAWNALLKTIEEPPAHAKFIFATTEVNKVLPTVISRCQRFDLRRIKTRDIAARLRYISDQEHVQISDKAIEVIAQAADGGMRDAQSLLDQLISFFGTEDGAPISEQQALSLFGLTAPSDMQDLLKALLVNDRIRVITDLHTFAAQSKNLETLYEEIIAWLRAILLCRILPNPASVLEETPEKIATCMELSRLAKPSSVQRLLENLSASGYLLRDAINKQVFLEAILLKAMRIAHAAQIEDLIARLNQLRGKGELDALNSVVPLYELPPGEILAPAASAFVPKSAGCTGTPSLTMETVPAAEETQRPEPAAPVSAASPEPITAKPAAEKVSPVPLPPSPPLPESALPSSAATEELEPETESVFEVPDSDVLPGPDVPASPLPESDEDAGSLWQRMILDAREVLKKSLLAGFMLDGTPLSFHNGRLVIGFDSDYETMQGMMVEKEISLLTRRLQALTENSSAILLLERRPGLATAPQIKEREDMDELKKSVSADPLIRNVVQTFHGRVVDVHRPDESVE